MAWQPNQAYLGKIGGDTGNYQQSSAQMMQNAQAAMGSQRPIQEAPDPTLGGAIGAAAGGVMTGLGASAAMSAAGMGASSAAFGGALPAMVASGPGMLVAGGIGLLSYLFS